MTTRRLARLSVLKRWAMAIVVRPRIRLSKANWISRSVSVSTDDVASSRIKMRGSINRARAMLIRCRSPPESDWPALADQRIVAVGQAEDELVGPGGLGGGDEFFTPGIGPAVGDVLGDGAVKQERLLQDQADMLAIFLDGERADVGAVDEDGPFGHVVKAAGQIHQRRLARPAGADQPDHFARLDREVDSFHDGAGAVAESDVAEFDPSAEPARMNRMDRLGDGRLAIHDAEDPLRRGGRPLRGREHAAHRIQPHVEAADVGQEQVQRADRQVVVDRPARRPRSRR